MELDILEGPTPNQEGSLWFLVEADQRRFHVAILPTRAIATPTDVPPHLASLAMRFAGEFSQKNRLLVHRMLGEARITSNTPLGEVLPPARILAAPNCTDVGTLLFTGTVSDETITIEIDRGLQPSRIRLQSGQPCTEHIFYAAYDAALDYMENNLATIASLGFDTSVMTADY
jgi:hypothetical protein